MMNLHAGMSWIGRLTRVGAKIPFVTRLLATSIHPKPFDKILIANRGEIACRVIRTAKKLGVKTVAVYSDVDASSMHVREADEAYCIGRAPSRESYLCMEKIIDVAKRSGAQAIHPGYGFLSENPRFVDLVEASGLVFIGPSSGPMNAMGDKINSKRIAKNAGCFVIPGYEGEVPNEDEAARLAAEVGYPVMIKASAGGGGKGMRVAYNEEEVREGFRLSQSEARSSFGDDRMLIERFIEDPHHIEIQVLADSHGNVVAFPERECSVQRRNQKVVEESPSCLLTPATRRAMQEQAIMLCKATHYRSAGTVEMLADGQQNFYFLEMNTRLQVEHPVTELVTGEDLVEHMLWIAAGRALPPRLADRVYLQAEGWAVESRVYAEDPLRGFLPSTGPLTHYLPPPANFTWLTGGCSSSGSGSGGSSGSSSGSSRGNIDVGVTVRIDSGVCEGSHIGVHYDPMIAKLCTHAPTRAGAIAVMETALDAYVVRGVGNNISFLRAVYRNEQFRQGDYGTSFIAEQFPDSFTGVELSGPERSLLVGSTVALHLSTDFRTHPNSPIVPSSSRAPRPGARGGEGGADVMTDVMYVHVASVAATPDVITHRYRVQMYNGGGGSGSVGDVAARGRSAAEHLYVIDQLLPDQLSGGDSRSGGDSSGGDNSSGVDSRSLPGISENRPSGDQTSVIVRNINRAGPFAVVDAVISDTDGSLATPYTDLPHMCAAPANGTVALSASDLIRHMKDCRAGGGLGSEPEPLLLQVDRPHTTVGHAGVAGEVYKIRMHGSDAVCVIQTPLEFRLSPHMLPAEIRDLSRQLLCPMPGMLMACDVSAGQRVEAGQQLCCVEAMKMVNVLRAAKAGVIAKVHCIVGAHLKVDQVIMEFE